MCDVDIVNHNSFHLHISNAFRKKFNVVVNSALKIIMLHTVKSETCNLFQKSYAPIAPLYIVRLMENIFCCNTKPDWIAFYWKLVKYMVHTISRGKYYFSEMKYYNNLFSTTD